MITDSTFTILGSDARPIRGDIRRGIRLGINCDVLGDVGREEERFKARGDKGTMNGAAKGVVVFCHGLKGFKDWGGWPQVMRNLAEAGFVAISFNYSHGGIGDIADQFTELELFKKNTYAREREDLEHVLDAIEARQLPGLQEINPCPVFLLGHSRGGACAICVGAKRDDVRAVATLASISSLGRVPSGLEKEWRKEGVRYIENSRTKQRLPLGVGLLDEILADRDIVEHSAKKLNKPLLIIHGTDDEAVADTAAKDIAAWAPQVQLEIIAGADHTFGMRHPIDTSSNQAELFNNTIMNRQVMPLLIDFFKQGF